MKHMTMQLQNLITAQKYDVSVSDGDGSIDMKGWDGVAVGPTQPVNLSGSGVQRVGIMAVPSSGIEWSGDTFDDPSLWEWESGTFDGGDISSGRMNMLLTPTKTNGSNFSSLYDIAGNEFDFEIDALGGSMVMTPDQDYNLTVNIRSRASNEIIQMYQHRRISLVGTQYTTVPGNIMTSPIGVDKNYPTTRKPIRFVNKDGKSEIYIDGILMAQGMEMSTDNVYINVTFSKYSVPTGTNMIQWGGIISNDSRIILPE